MDSIRNLMDEVYDDVFIEAEVQRADTERAAELARLKKEREEAAAQEAKEKAENEKKKKELRKKIAKCLIAIAAGIAAIIAAKKILELIKKNKTKQNAEFVKQCEEDLKKLEDELKGNESLLKKFDGKLKTPGGLSNNEYEQVMDLIKDSQKKANQAIRIRVAANKRQGYKGDTAENKDTGTYRNMLDKFNKKEEEAKANFTPYYNFLTKRKLGKHAKEWLEEDKEKKARAKAAARQAGGSVFSKLTGKINAVKASPEANKRAVALEAEVKRLAGNMKNGKEFNTEAERDRYVSVWNAWVDALNAAGDNRKDLDKIKKDGKLGIKVESVEVDVDILKTTIYREFVNYTTEEEYNYLDSMVESACNILNELVIETYTPIIDALEKAYTEGTLDKYQYDELCVVALERMSDEYLICD